MEGSLKRFAELSSVIKSFNRRFASDTTKVLNPMEQSNEVFYTTKSEDDSAIGDCTPSIGVYKSADILFLRRDKVCEVSKALFANTIACGLLDKSESGQDGIYHWRCDDRYVVYFNGSCGDVVDIYVLFVLFDIWIVVLVSIVRREHAFSGPMISRSMVIVLHEDGNVILRQ